jgi:hypothetical protein
MQARTVQLSSNFTEYLESFRKSDTFVGPSVYFHNKTLEIRRRCGTVRETLQSDQFYDYLYATLTAWGMHRMGKGYTKLGDIEEMKSSFRAQVDRIVQLEELSLLDIDVAILPKIITAVWAVLSHLKVSLAVAQIVANSKALHHVLPALVPPIDHTYTYTFLYNRNNLSIAEAQAFPEMYSCFHYIASNNRGQIKASLGKAWNTSETKTIDNAIVGYVLKELRSQVGEASV